MRKKQIAKIIILHRSSKVVSTGELLYKKRRKTFSLRYRMLDPELELSEIKMIQINDHIAFEDMENYIPIHNINEKIIDRLQKNWFNLKYYQIWIHKDAKKW